MITAKTTYTGGLRTLTVHVRSGVELVTDAPVDNKGRGESFSPTDLVAVALATCMLTTIGIKIENQGINIEGANADITKIMASSPRRVSKVDVTLDFSKGSYSEEQKEFIKNTALTCPVALSLNENIIQDVKFIF